MSTQKITVSIKTFRDLLSLPNLKHKLKESANEIFKEHSWDKKERNQFIHWIKEADYFHIFYLAAGDTCRKNISTLKLYRSKLTLKFHTSKLTTLIRRFIRKQKHLLGSKSNDVGQCMLRNKIISVKHRKRLHRLES